MSRSYKKYSCWKDSNSKFGKKRASRAVRLAKTVGKGAYYKKVFDTWDICDFRIYEPFMTAEDFRKKWSNPRDKDYARLRRDYRSWKEAYRYWRKCIAK